MNQVSENDIHEIVVKVVRQTLGVEAVTPDPKVEPQDSNAVPQEAAIIANPEDVSRLVVAIGSDHGGVELKAILMSEIADAGFEAMDCGTHTTDAVDYPDIAFAVASLVVQGKAWRGVVIDGAGIGSCMAANKVPGVRAAMCYDYATAVNSREHNDANVLTLGAGLIGVNLAKQILKTWLVTEFGGGRHAKRVDKIMEIEKKYLNDGMVT
jgi:ribose 5-phosphate isomerase B